jgi:GT2 family glycosyltransferase
MLADMDWDRPQEVAHSQMTCLLVRGEAWEKVGDMDPDLFLFYNDVDFCRRIRRAGWKIVHVPEPRVLHHGSASVETASWKERQLWKDRYRYYEKWYGVRGTLGVRFACIHRAITRALAQVVKGRFGRVGPIWRVGLDLYRSLDARDDAR